MKIIKYPTPQDYHSIIAQSANLAINRTDEDEDQLWSMEHTAGYTIGTQGDLSHILSNPQGIPVGLVDRGGEATYLGPGIIAVHTLIGFRDKSYSVSEFIRRLESAVIATLASMNITGTTDPANPGVYVNGKKIASVGLACVNRSVYHGIALYYNMDKSAFANILVCGQEGLAVTDIVECGGSMSQGEVEDLLLSNITSQLV